MCDGRESLKLLLKERSDKHRPNYAKMEAIHVMLVLKGHAGFEASKVLLFYFEAG